MPKALNRHWCAVLSFLHSHSGNVSSRWRVSERRVTSGQARWWHSSVRTFARRCTRNDAYMVDVHVTSETGCLLWVFIHDGHRYLFRVSVQERTHSRSVPRSFVLLPPFSLHQGCPAWVNTKEHEWTPALIWYDKFLDSYVRVRESSCTVSTSRYPMMAVDSSYACHRAGGKQGLSSSLSTSALFFFFRLLTKPNFQSVWQHHSKR